MFADVVHWLTEAGLDIVPIPPSINGAEAAATFQWIHGLFLHPGYAGIDATPRVTSLVNTFLTMAYESKDFFVWGTCQGFQQIIAFIGGDTLDHYNATDYFHPTHNHVMHSRLPHIDFKYNIHYFNHRDGLSVARFEHNRRLRTTFNIIAKNKDRQGHEYVAIIEGKQLPWFGCQFHPEKYTTDTIPKFIAAELAKSKHNGFQPRPPLQLYKVDNRLQIKMTDVD